MSDVTGKAIVRWIKLSERELEVKKLIREALTRHTVMIMGNIDYSHIDWVNFWFERPDFIISFLTGGYNKMEQLVMEPG